MRQTCLAHQFVEFIPERLDEGILYISQRYSTAAHNCCCGCGEEVITPLNPTDWSLRVESNDITLYPSIGNWSLSCRSHYWIRKSKVIWAGQMTQKEIERGRAVDHNIKNVYFKGVNRKKSLHEQLSSNEAPRQDGATGLLFNLWIALKRWWKL